MSGGRILALGVNRTRNHPEIVCDPKTQAAYHAEVAALMACPKTIDLKNATIYVARVNRDGVKMMSRPCDNCMKALKARGIRKIVYTIENVIEL